MTGNPMLVLGSSFGGFNAASHLRKLPCGKHEISVVSSDPLFTFIPSQPRVVAGMSDPADVQCPVGPRLPGGILAAPTVESEVVPTPDMP